MRVIILLASIALAHGAKLENAYLPPTNARTAGGPSFLQTPLSGNYQNQRGIGQFGQIGNEVSQIGVSQFGKDFARAENFAKIGAEYDNVNYFAQARPERPRAALERNAAILRQDNNNDGESFSYAYETENGIYAEESGVATNGVEAQGGYSYTGDDGQVYSVRYTADQNGFVPQGDHIPTPPPVPVEILKALEQNARDEAAGIYDDGSYNDRKYTGGNIYNGFNSQNQNNFEDSVVTNAAFSRLTPNAALTAASFNGAGNVAPFNTYTAGNAALNTISNVNKAYLPPFPGQVRNGGRRQGFNARTGYNY